MGCSGDVIVLVNVFINWNLGFIKGIIMYFFMRYRVLEGKAINVAQHVKRHRVNRYICLFGHFKYTISSSNCTSILNLVGKDISATDFDPGTCHRC